MRLSRASLGLKLNLALLAFFLVLGSATAAFVFVGFDRTQDHTNERSRQALEEQGKLSLQALAGGATEAGGLRFEAAAAIGQRAARYLQDFTATGAVSPLDVAGFVQTPVGVWYDPAPDRISDIVVLNHAQLEGAVLDDVRYSAALDAIFPALVEPFPGELTEEAYHPIAIIFIGVNGVGRYYPPIGVHEGAPAEFDTSYLVDKFGSVANSERRTIWTTPYEDLNGQGLVVTAQTPIYQGDRFRGLFEVDLSIDKLVEEVGQIRPTDSGFAFYVDSEGEILRRGANDLLLREVDFGQNASLAAVLDAMISARGGSVVVEKVGLEGREFFIAFAPMPSIGGSFAVAAPVDEVTAEAAAITAEIGAQADRTMLLVLGSMTTLFAFALMGATYLNRRVLVRPIEALVIGTRSVAEGDFATQIAVHGNDELAALGRSFNQMTEDIQREVREREGTQNELQALFASMSDMVFTVDREGRFLRVPETNSPMRYTMPHGTAGQTLYDVMPKALVGSLLDSIRNSLQERRTVTIEFAREASGRTEWHSAAISPLSDEAIVAVVRDITDRVNARQELERQVEERTRELTALLDISRNVASTLELRPLLQLVIEQLRGIADFRVCTVHIAEGDNLELVDYRGGEANSPKPAPAVALAEIQPIWSEITAGRPLIIEDVGVDSRAGPDYRTAASSLLRGSGGVSWMGVPLSLKDRVIGLLSFWHPEAAYYTKHHASLVSAIASQIAVAIENARLYQQAQELAAVEERQRLARELHDSVSQALYGIALSATAAQTLIGDEQSPARQPIDFVMTLTQAAMAEMRALIFELRPESLEMEGLVAALEKQVAATAARYGIAIAKEIGEEPDIGLSVKEALYRVCQEALHNVIKHSNATSASVSLSQTNGMLTLEITDDGLGFDTTQNFPGHIGLISMSERAATIGATCEILSAPGLGTTVRVFFPT